MNDPIKDFVEQHREDFDHLEAPKFDLAGLKAKIAQKSAIKKHRVLSIKPAQWIAAAAVLLVSALGFWFFNKTEQLKSPEQHLVINRDRPKEVIAKPDGKVATHNKEDIQLAKHQATLPVKRNRFKKENQPMEEFDPMLVKQLSDSTSSSNRLAAVLAIKKSDFISYDLLDRLSGTIQHDSNSNVRLAALSVLEKYQQDAHVSNLLITALNHQDDPMVQLSLVNLLGKMQNIKIEERLYALVNDPSTMEAVKDEAYQILLKENKF